MTETFPLPASPPTEVIFGFLDSEGNYRSRGFGSNEAGDAVPLLRPNDDVMGSIQENVETWRAGVHTKLQQALAGVPRAEADLGLDRMDHYYQALGLSAAPVVVVRNVGDLPKSGFAKVFSDVFYNNPHRSGYYFNVPRLVVAAERLQVQSPHNLEHTIVHEKAHGTGRNTVMVMLSPTGELKAVVVRNGFSTLSHFDDRAETVVQQGERAEESQAEMFAGTYARLFLPREETMVIRNGSDQLEVDAKYGQKDPRDGITMTSAPLAMALELIIERDPSILEHLVAARVSIDGLRRFATGVNGQVPKFYGQLLHGRHQWDANVDLLTGVVDTLYDGDRDVLKKTGGAVLSFVVNKLQAYEQQTGYDFGLPAAYAEDTKLAA